ncbi:MAG: DNA-binding protein WhiA [Clostridiales bacterium]|nr:DNA-binding protein WhiA [Clostridiales bacterium]
MSFSSTAKDELIRLPLGKSCCILSELSALTQTSGSLALRGLGRVQVTYRVENTALARRIFMLLRTQLNITAKLHFVQHSRLGGRRSCVLTLGDQDSQTLLIALHMMERDEEGHISFKRTAPRHPMTRQCCRRAFLRGAFLGCGSMTNPEKSYHFEWVAEDQSLRQTLAKLLDKSGLPVHEHVRKGQNVMYLKGAQQIADMLALMGANQAVLEMENIRITKQMRAGANRASNCDEHNSERMLNAADEQIEAIKLISIQRGLFTLPPGLQEIARLRLEHTSLSLNDLGQLMDPPVGKSGVNHRMRRLMDIAKEIRATLPIYTEERRNADD